MHLLQRLLSCKMTSTDSKHPNKSYATAEATRWLIENFHVDSVQAQKLAKQFPYAHVIGHKDNSNARQNHQVKQAAFKREENARAKERDERERKQEDQIQILRRQQEKEREAEEKKLLAQLQAKREAEQARRDEEKRQEQERATLLQPFAEKTVLFNNHRTGVFKTFEDIKSHFNLSDYDVQHTKCKHRYPVPLNSRRAREVENMLAQKIKEKESIELELDDLLSQQQQLLLKSNHATEPLVGSGANQKKTILKRVMPTPTDAVIIENHFSVLETLADSDTEVLNAQQKKAEKLMRSITATAAKLKHKQMEIELFPMLDVHTLTDNKCMVCGKILRGIPIEWRDSANHLCREVLKPKKPVSCTRSDAIILKELRTETDDAKAADTGTNEAEISDAFEPDNDDDTDSLDSDWSYFNVKRDYSFTNLQYESSLREWSRCTNNTSAARLRLIYFVMVEKVPTNKQMEQLSGNRCEGIRRYG